MANTHIPDNDAKTLYLLDEKRLLYVATTRAKSHLYITYAKVYEGRKTEAKPSKFLTEINFKQNPLVDFKEFKVDPKALPVSSEPLEQLKQEYQASVVNSIHQMNLCTAIQKIVGLGKIKYFKEHKTLDGFDSADLLKTDGEPHIDDKLYHKPAPLIKKETFRLSPSKIDTYEDCPLKFKFQYVLRVPQLPKTYFAMGRTMHSVAEQLVKMEQNGTKPTKELALEVFEQQWDSALYRNQRTKESQDKATSKEMIKTYLDWDEKNPNTPVDVETKFKISIHDATISGIIDRVEMTPDGEYEVIDFKTGKAYKNKNTIKNDIQMNVYALGTEKLYQKLPKKTSLFYIKSNEIVSHFIDRERLEEFKTTLGETVDDIFDEKFQANPGWKCRWCDYAQICDEKDPI